MGKNGPIPVANFAHALATYLGGNVGQRILLLLDLRGVKQLPFLAWQGQQFLLGADGRFSIAYGPNRPVIACRDAEHFVERGLSDGDGFVTAFTPDDIIKAIRHAAGALLAGPPN